MSYEGWGPDSSDNDTDDATSGRIDRRRWWRLNGAVRFYGFVLLAGTKAADAATTAIGVRYVPGIVETNPLAHAVFVGEGTLAGLAVLSFVTVSVAVLVAELLAVEIRRRLHRDRLAILSKSAVYAGLSCLFGAVAVSNALLISEQVQQYLGELLTVGF